MRNKKMGTLYVVATPIGNLQDITLRAIEVLKSVELVAAEDTRHSGALLKHFSINKPILSLHDHNERTRYQQVLAHLTEGKSIALISDAGTPLISDPGYLLVKEAKAHEFNVVPIPGPSAFIAALSVSGLPTDKFTFQGFLPAKSVACQKALMQLVHESATMIFYEAPHRLRTVLKNMVEVFGGERNAVIARELTKLHESVMTGNLNEHLNRLTASTQPLRGEIVILIEGCKEEPKKDSSHVSPDQVLDLLLQELPLKQAVRLASQLTGKKKNDFYKLALLKKISK